MEDENQIIIEKLTEWGCDIEGAMPRFINNKEFYCQLLREVPEEADFVLLGEAINSKDLNRSFELAHTLKGMLANMGLKPMFEYSYIIVEKLRSGTFDNVKENYDNLMSKKQMLEDILNNISK